MARRRPDRRELALRMLREASPLPPEVLDQLDRAPTNLHFEGEIISVQPRIRLLRSFDQANHVYLGYALLVRPSGAAREPALAIGIGKSAQAKHRLRVGEVVEGDAKPVQDVRLETVQYYKVTGLRVVSRRTTPMTTPPPWMDVPPELPVYRARGHRRLDARTYTSKCLPCMWGCHMAVEMVIDQWNPEKRKYRTETFCYGPKSCPCYRAGPKRVVPGRKGMKYVAEDWIEEEATRHRGEDE